MASQLARTSPTTAAPFLSTDQQDLLAAALTSQALQASNRDSEIADIHPEPPFLGTRSSSMDDALQISPHQADLDSFGVDYTPDLDYLDGDNFDFDNADLGGDMIGALPGSGGDGLNGDHHEKRKNSDDSEEGDAKRQEVQEGGKSAKKPGRKPLTSEPTTKRKAQNRAAQRAFRERKEKHLKDLETKVDELTKSDEAKQHENGVLKAQIERLQTELREYRKRLSLNRGSDRNTSPTGLQGTAHRNSNVASAGPNNFAFDFPKFGTLPGSQIFGNSSMSASPTADAVRHNSLTQSNTGSPDANSTPGSQIGEQRQRTGSNGGSLSPQVLGSGASIMTTDTSLMSSTNDLNLRFTMHSSANNMHGFANTLPQMRAEGSDPFGDLFSPSILQGANIESSGHYFGQPADVAASTYAQTDKRGYGTDSNRAFQQFNSATSSIDSTSPSASSSNWNANATSSCSTSPAPSHDSPANKDKSIDSFTSVVAAPTNPAPTKSLTDLSNGFFGFGDYNVPSTESFNPVLFGDYRDSNEAIVGGGDFTGGFFDDALNPAPYDLGSPSNLFGILQSPTQVHASTDTVNAAPAPAAPAPAAPTTSQNLMAKMDEVCGGGADDYGLPSADKPEEKRDGTGKLISCNNIWNQLQATPEFQAGTFDLDGLCSELRSKARCSQSGVLVDADHVDAALRKLGGSKEPLPASGGGGGLLFEQAGWDNVLQKMNRGKK